MNQQPPNTQQILLYLSGDHPCSYLEDRNARTLFVDPQQTNRLKIYNSLINQGFRRSGEMIYRPDCKTCQGCISLRIPVAQFKPRRNQRRIWKRLYDSCAITELPAEFDPAHFSLFKRYINTRHPGGDMSAMTEADYINFIGSRWAESRIFAFHQDKKLLAISVTDLLQDGLSAVYTFFDPDFEQLSLGTFSLLWQIEECKRRNLTWLYLGYWIEACQKMAYKNQYHPHEAYINGEWVIK
ncbi:MAG: arginyltransferase [Sedimenticola thiotaurini]|uniref:Aspartate/glutamate leucyltransferase n=1 Tax=Sedimenticola thiotaurini TaxID=1543721 RepID=A0A558CNT4_9GAMM|nr:MAG: arginyltransferase [Sedimenticola thiotaurini]